MNACTDILAVLSLLHESADDHSGIRRFRDQAVLAWTLRRVKRSQAIDAVVIVCWDDQASSVAALAEQAGAKVASQGPRRLVAPIQAVAAARRWTDGWRGGPLGTSAFDAGYHPAAVKQLADAFASGAVVLIDPAAALVDPALLDALVDQFHNRPAVDFTFTPAATGLGGMLLTRSLVDRLAASNSHPGRLLHYFPDQISREPIAMDPCVPTPTAVARSIHRYTLTSARQVRQMDAATAPLNGELAGSDAETIVRHMNDVPLGVLPREVVLELTTRRATRPIFHPLAYAGQNRPTALDTARPDLSLDAARRLIDELAELDDSRLTLAGLGDPLLHPDFLSIIQHAADRGVAVHVETDLLPPGPELVAQLAESPADIVSIHLPALTPGTYAAVMGVDAYPQVLTNVQAFVARRAAAGLGTPLVVPIFIKCRQNLHEMEPWYDQWLRAVGSAVVVGATTFARLIPDVAVADMSPPLRVPCRRLSQRLTVLSDARYTTCEQDACGRQSLGTVGQTELAAIWRQGFAALRKSHADNRWRELPVCAGCSEWHR